MRRIHWWLWPGAAAVVATAVATTMTYLDWRLNPGGIFHGPEGTNAAIVRATWLSWFLPLSALCAAVVLGVLPARERRALGDVAAVRVLDPGDDVHHAALRVDLAFGADDEAPPGVHAAGELGVQRHGRARRRRR